jgi:threonine dehydratase
VGETSLVSIEEIEAARIRLQPVVRTTRSTYSHGLSARCGTEVWLKPEHLQRTGSFKIRGAYNMQAQLPPGTSVVAASAGNHAQGVALAASLLDHHATIFMPRNASLPKVQATRAYGAEVILEGATTDDALDAAHEHAEATGSILVPPFDHSDVIAGQGTIGLELIDEVPGLANVLVAIGGGGLLSGIAAAIRARAPDVRVIGVMADGASSMSRSRDTGVVTAVEPQTIADGIALGAPCELTLHHVSLLVDDLVSVPDEAISAALLLLVERAKAVVEPAGAAALAPLLGDVELEPGATVAVLGGGNVDPVLLTKLVDHGLSVAGRYLVVRVIMGDRPGTLATLTNTIAEMGLNVLDVEHHRSGLRLQLGTVEVQLTLETRDHEHRATVMKDLIAAGFQVDLVE